MKKYRIVQLGAGSFGSQWLEHVFARWDGAELAGVVSTNKSRYNWIMKTAGLRQDQIFENLETALDVMKPDLLLNVTPPAVHLATSLAALKRGIAVLCEKPIALNREEAAALLKASDEYRKPVYIAENYRFFHVMQKVKKLIEEGVIGHIQSIGVEFYRNHHVTGTTNYHMELEHPLLMDVSIHHFDLVRFFTGSDAASVCAAVWAPPNSHYPRNANADVLFNMKNGVQVSYRGQLAAHSDETAWTGNWRIEGDRGIMRIKDSCISISGGNGEDREYTTDSDDLSGRSLLTDIFESVEQGCGAQSDIHDNIRTLDMVFAAIDSSRSKGEPVWKRVIPS
ncbi:MAG: Gfo/Idh/MocA family oxidoreductase [Treponema sp.]|jgi:predicted dehydrogenase|nr:Gfo/Idh/MocA family oxidoreductase [Treponema sp.]